MSARVRLAATLVLAWVLGSAVLWVVGLPEYWESLTGEDSAMTWLQSVVLVVASVSALVVAWLTRLAGRAGTAVWCLLALAYVGLALDERFTIHDRVRAGRLLPRDAREQLIAWVGPGEALLLVVAVAGVVALPLVLRAVREDPWARTALVVGVVLAVVTLVADSIDPSVWTPAQERIEAGVEEVVELGGAVAFLASVLLRLVSLVQGLVPAGTQDPVPDDEITARSSP